MHGRLIRRTRGVRALALTALAVAAPAALLLATPPGAPAQGAARPNIIFVFPDDHATHAIGAYGSEINETPNIDRLAREGMLFRNAFVTNSICAPARAVVLTGRLSHINGVYDNGQSFDGSQVTFPKLLQDAGYQTAIVGKWHLKSAPTGFDHWKVLVGQGDYYNPTFLTPEGLVRQDGYVSDVITDETLAWLDSGRDPDRPFMLMYPHKAPHRTWAPGPDHLLMYEGEQIPEPSTLFDGHEGRASVRRTQTMSIAEDLNARDLKLDDSAGGNRLTPEQRRAWDAAYDPRNEAFHAANLTGDDLVRWKYQRYIRDYLRSVASVDDNLGRLLDYLDESGLAENTIVVYSSDQGFFLGDHGWFDKRWMYEESLRTPLIVRWPEVVSPGSENGALVQNLDFAQTFLEMAGARAPGWMQGRSLVPLLRGSTPDDWRESIYYHYYEFPAVHCVARHYGVRTDRYKLIHYYQHGEWELFDVQEDPDEVHNLYDDPRYADVVGELKDELVRLRHQYHVPETDPEGLGRPDLASSGECTPAAG